MKKIFQVNKWLIIINVILFVIPYFGLMFLIVLGSIQVIMTLIIFNNYKRLDKSGKTQLIIYSVLTITTLVITKLTFNDRLYYNDTIFILFMITSLTLAFLHLNITYLLYKSKK